MTPSAESLLGVSLPASPEEIRAAYRKQIARYHPDKVHHLGDEFQVLAAEKSAALTGAYRALLNAPGASKRSALDEAADPAEPASHPADAAQDTGLRWGAVSANCPSLILTAATQRLISVIGKTLPNSEDVAVTGYLYARRSSAGWREMMRRTRPTAALVRVQADTADGQRADRRPVRPQLPGVDGPIVVFDLKLGCSEPSDAAGQRRERPEAGVFVVSVDARTWRTAMPDGVPAIASEIMTRVRESRG